MFHHLNDFVYTTARAFPSYDSTYNNKLSLKSQVTDDWQLNMNTVQFKVLYSTVC